MTPTLARSLRIDEELWEAMQFIAERDGVPVPEQVRRGIRLWLESKGVQPKAQPRTRRKPRSA